MKKVNFTKVTEELTGRFGINLKCSYWSDRIEIRPTEIEYGVGFILKVSLEWRNLTAEFIPDNFSSALLKTMGAAPVQKKENFKLLAQKCIKNSNDIYMSINGEEVNPFEPIFWNEHWNQLYIKLSKVPIFYNDLEVSQLENAILDVSGDLLGLLLSLLPLEEEVAIEESSVGLPEGALTRIEVNRYERSPFNREACLKIHGSICMVCNFDFEKKYGILGKGFIHIHHIVPVSELGNEYVLNPEKDLAPVCPNCHNMIHKKHPPYTIEELKGIISSNNVLES